MLILDKHKAVERMLALAEGQPAVDLEGRLDSLHGRTYRRVATFERRTSFDATPSRRAERRAGLLQPAGGAPSWY